MGKYNVGDRIGPDKILLLERLNYTGNYHYNGLFECPHCKEHKTFIARISAVAQGKTRSCGCLHGNKKDLTGKLYYNSVQVISPTQKRAFDGSVIWKCKCLWCDEEFEVSSSRLENGSITSCGCSSGSFGERLIHKMLKDQCILIEIDGEYHQMDEIREDDNIKNNYCKNNNIPLIRIPTSHLQDIKIQDLLLDTTSFRIC